MAETIKKKRKNEPDGFDRFNRVSNKANVLLNLMFLLMALVCIIPVLAKKSYENFCGNWNGENGISALYFTYEGKGKCDFRAFTIN